jgi:Spy/CpxP family protein refolding chaperone
MVVDAADTLLSVTHSGAELMNITRLQSIAMRAVVLGAVVAVTANVAVAQKAKPSGPPVVTKGTVKSNPKADKGQAQAEASRLAARERKIEHDAFKSADHEPKSALKGIKLTDEQKLATKAIEKRYADQFKALQKADKAADKAGTDDVTLAAKVDALRLQERAELRNVLTTEQQAEFDRNLAPKVARKS